MKHGTKNQAKGTVKELKGAAKETSGKVLGDEELEAEGMVEKTVGKVQRKLGTLEKRLRK